MKIGGFYESQDYWYCFCIGTHCHDICCTGGKAAETLAEIQHTTIPKVGKYIETVFADRTIRFWRMPSTSRAYPLAFDKKAIAYQRMFNEVRK